MKAISVLTACVAATVLGVSACANPTDAGEAQQQGSADIIDSVEKDDDIAATLPEDIRTSGHITVSINPDVEPVKFLDADGNIVGLNPDLLRAAGTVLGIEIDFQEGTFDSMVPGLASKRYDLIASIGDYVERQKQIDFIDYLKSGTGLLASTSVDREISSPDDLCGLAVGYTRGTSQQELVESAAKACDQAGEDPIEISPYGDTGAGILALESGEDDAYWGDLPNVRYNAEQEPDLFELVYSEQESVYGIGVNKDDTQLRDALRAALRSLAADGVYDELLKQWNQEDYGLPGFPINDDLSLEH